MSETATSVRDVRFLTIAEVAQLLRVSRMTVYRMVTAGTLRAVRVSERTLRVPERELRRYLAQQRKRRFPF